MSAGLNALAGRTLARIDWRDPLDDHELNVGRLFWLLAAPGRYGGPIAWDVVNGLPCTLAGYTSGYGWSPQTAIGGSGSLFGNGYVNCGKPSLQSASKITVAASFKATTITLANSPCIFSFGYNGSVSGWDLGFNQTGSSTNLDFVSYNGSTVYGATSTGVTFSTGVWYRAVGVWTGSVWKLYVNGTDRTSAWNTQSAPSITTARLLIGANDNNGTAIRQWPGYLDNLTVLPGVAWSAGMVALDYQLGPQGYPGVLRRRYPKAYSLPASPAAALIQPPKVLRPALHSIYLE